MSAALTSKYRDSSVPAIMILAIVAGIVVGMLGVKFSTTIALAAALGVLVGMVLLRFPNYALYLTVALIPIERFGRFTDDNTEFTISLMRIMGMVALAVLLIHRFVRKKPITFGPAFFMYGGYVAMGFLSVLYTTDTLGTVRGASSIFGNLLFFFVVVNMATSRRLIIVSIIIWLAVSAGITVYSTYDWHFGSGQSDLTVMSGDDDPGKGVQTQENRWATVWEDHAELESLGSRLRRSMGPTSHAAVYAINCILTIPFFLYILRLPVSRIWKFLALAALALAGYNILLTNTRAAILVAGLIGLLCLVRGLVRLRPGQYIALLIVLISSIGFIPSDVFTRILDLSNYSLSNSASLRIRIEYARAGLEAISEHWLYGSGLANENIVPSHLNSWSAAPERTTVHNEYLQTLMEVGFIGGFFLYGFVGLLFYYAVRAARNFSRNSDTEQEYWLMIAIQIAMLSVVIYGAQVDVFHFPLKGWWLLAGITVSMFTLSNHMMADSDTPDQEPALPEAPAHA